MIYEKRIGSVLELRRQLATLDGDAGVRVLGVYEGARCFAFVTRFHEKYTLLVYRAEGKPQLPRSVIASKELSSVSDVMEILEAIAGPTLEAFAY